MREIPSAAGTRCARRSRRGACASGKIAGWRQANYAKPAAVIDCLRARAATAASRTSATSSSTRRTVRTRARARRSRDLPRTRAAAGARGAPVMTLHVQQALQLTHSAAGARAVAFWAARARDDARRRVGSGRVHVQTPPARRPRFEVGDEAEAPFRAPPRLRLSQVPLQREPRECAAGEAPGVVRREDRPGESRDDDAAGDGAGDDGDDRLRPAPRSVRPPASDAAAEVFARLRARAALVDAFGTGDALALPPGSLDGVDVSNLKQWPGFVSLGARGRDGSSCWRGRTRARRAGSARARRPRVARARRSPRSCSRRPRRSGGRGSRACPSTGC